MKFIFKTDLNLAKDSALIVTHPEEQALKKQIEGLLQHSKKTIIVIDGLNNRNVQVPVDSILVIESEERMCNLRLKNGDMYLYNKRLKTVEEELLADGMIRINNQMMVNIDEVKAFSAASNARIEVTLSDGSSYLISRYYVKAFRRALG
ncbi:LytTR family DNA-binding domain-containing protein [Eubacteriaceae bacterium ES2]|nr:LytTR family DNA-binding domain-containing protein [Eubacteriaceae bacterium ES2]